MRLPTWAKGSLLLTVTLAAGVLIGIAYERQRTVRHEPMDATAHDVMHRLARDLDLSEAQQTAIAQILAGRQSVVDSTWHEMQPHVRAALVSAEQEILAVLTPEQVTKYRAMTSGAHPRDHR
jgi:hypothetical protein